MLLSGSIGIAVDASIVATTTAKNIQRAEESILYEVSIDGYNLYLQCMKDDCQAERIGQKAVVAVVHKNLCKRGYKNNCRKY